MDNVDLWVLWLANGPQLTLEDRFEPIVDLYDKYKDEDGFLYLLACRMEPPELPHSIIDLFGSLISVLVLLPIALLNKT